MRSVKAECRAHPARHRVLVDDVSERARAGRQHVEFALSPCAGHVLGIFWAIRRPVGACSLKSQSLKSRVSIGLFQG